jgi:hypothetical protein
MNNNTPNRSAEDLGIPGPYAQVKVIDGLKNERFAIRGNILAALAAQAGHVNPHRLSSAARISYQTARRYLINPGTDLKNEPKAIDLETFFDILIDGIGLSWVELAELPFGAIFALLVDETYIGKDLIISPSLVSQRTAELNQGQEEDHVGR